MAFFVSTGRKPSMPSRALAKWLARLGGGKSGNRGKSSLDELVARAEKAGLTRLVFVYESHGNPSALTFYDAEKGWLDAEFKISSWKIPEKEAEGGKRKRVPAGVELKVVGDGKQQKKLEELFGTADENAGVEEENETVELHFDGEKMWFEFDGEKIGPELKGEIRVEEKSGEK